MSGDADRLWNQSMPEIYDRMLGGAVFAPHARDLARRASELSASNVLELAAGTGILTRELVTVLPDAAITATDLNPGMVEYGSARVASPSWRQADATELPFPDQSFDLVVCQFGVMFFPDRRTAYAEASRVLVPEGAFLFNVWDRIETSPFTAAVVAGLAEMLPDDPPTFLQRIPHGYHDPLQITADLEASGFRAIDIHRTVLSGRSTAQEIAAGFCRGTPLLAEIQQRLSPEVAVEAASRKITDLLGPDPIEAELGALTVLAGK